MRLFIVTPFSRPENFERLRDSIFRNELDSRIEWHVIVDASVYTDDLHNTLKHAAAGLPVRIECSAHANACVGHAHRNFFIDYYRKEFNADGERQNDWAYFLDDDNLLHPDFIDTVTGHLVSQKCAGIFHQDLITGERRLNADLDNVRVCHIDMAQYVINVSRLPHEIRFIEDDYCADGHFIEALFKHVQKAEFFIIDAVLSYYNALKPEKEKVAEGAHGIDDTKPQTTTPVDSGYKMSECPVPCLQHEDELLEFLEIFEAANPKKVIEIGTFFGGTMWFMIQRAKELEKFVSIDLMIPPEDDRYQKLLECQALWGGFAAVRDGIGNNLSMEHLFGNSRSENIIGLVRTIFPDNDVDVLHIDGDHTYDGVKADYYNYRDLVKPGGMIVFHDVEGIPDVNRFWNELIAENKDSFYRTISAGTENGGWGIGILIK